MLLTSDDVILSEEETVKVKETVHGERSGPESSVATGKPIGYTRYPHLLFKHDWGGQEAEGRRGF